MSQCVLRMDRLSCGPPELRNPILTARVGAEVNHQWLWSMAIRSIKLCRQISKQPLGSGHQIEVSFTGLAKKPDLKYILRFYDDLPFGDLQVEVINSGHEEITVQNIRVLDVIGSEPRVDLNGPEASDRVLSDSYSEDRPPLKIFDLGKEPPYLGEDDFGKGSGELASGGWKSADLQPEEQVQSVPCRTDLRSLAHHLRLKTAHNSSGTAQISLIRGRFHRNHGNHEEGVAARRSPIRPDRTELASSGGRPD